MMMDTKESGGQKIITVRQVVRTILFLVVFCGFLFLPAGKIDWREGWAYLIVGVGTLIMGRIHLALVHPDLIRERASYDEKSDVKPWDRWLMPLVAVIGPLATLVVAGLDERFGWTPDLALWVPLAALAILVLSIAFGHWATISNRFFAAVVRIQTDRGHHVVDTGPYRLMRHPAYASGVLTYLVMPLLLGSWWAYIPSGLTALAYIVRTALEDRTLRHELPGYEAYTQRTRYRLLPGVW